MNFTEQARTLLASLILAMPSLAAGEDYRQILAEWRAAESLSTSGLGRVQAMELAAQKMRTWQKQKGADFNWDNEQQRASFDLIEFALAKAWSRAGNYNKALEYLEKEASTYLKSEGGFLESTRDPSSFAKEVFALHSEIIAHTGVTSSIPGSGYEVFAAASDDKSPAFVFVHGSDGEFQSEFTTEGVEANEQKKMIYLFEPDAQGRYAVADRAQVIADRARFSVSARKNGAVSYLALGGIKKVIEYKPTSGYPDVRVSPLGQIELRVGAGKIEQPLAAIERVATPQKDQGASATPTKAAVPTAPSLSLPPTKAKPSEAAKQSLPNDEPASSTPWSIIVVLIVAATGLLWLLVKNRK
jgi:hypothetical protein